MLPCIIIIIMSVCALAVSTVLYADWFAGLSPQVGTSLIKRTKYTAAPSPRILPNNPRECVARTNRAIDNKKKLYILMAEERRGLRSYYIISL